MNYYQLSFANKAAADAALYRNGSLIHRATFIKGITYTAPVFNDAGTLVTPPVAYPGYRVFIAGEETLDNSLLPYVLPFSEEQPYVFYTENKGIII